MDENSASVLLEIVSAEQSDGSGNKGVLICMLSLVICVFYDKNFAYQREFSFQHGKPGTN